MSKRASPFVLIFLSGVVFTLLLVGSFFLGVIVGGKERGILGFSAVPAVPEQKEKAVEGESTDSNQKQPSTEAEGVKTPEEVPATPEAKFAKDFEKFLNEFLKDLGSETNVYKKDRRILKEVISPYNVEGTENAEKSYKAFKEDIAPTLRRKGQKIIDIFQNSENAVVALLAEQPEDVRSTLMSTWQEMKKKQLNGVIDFLANEERLIGAHERLLKFYFVHSKLYSVDPEKGEIVFKNPKYEQEEQEILGEIEKLRNYGKKEG